MNNRVLFGVVAVSILLFIGSLFLAMQGVGFSARGVNDLGVAREIELRGEPEGHQWVKDQWKELILEWEKSGRLNQFYGIATIVGANALLSLASLIITWWVALARKPQNK